MTKRPAAQVLPVSLVLLAALLGGCSGDGAPPSLTTTSAPPSTTGTSAPPSTTGTTTSALPSATSTRVEVGRVATLRPDVTVRVVGVRKVRLAAAGVGEVAGSGAAVRLRVGNASAGPVDLGQLVVNAYFGAGRTPAAPNTTTSRELSGSLKPGRSSTATYYFAVPARLFTSLVVEVSAVDSPRAITFVHD